MLKDSSPSRGFLHFIMVFLLISAIFQPYPGPKPMCSLLMPSDVQNITGLALWTHHPQELVSGALPVVHCQPGSRQRQGPRHADCQHRRLVWGGTPLVRKEPELMQEVEQYQLDIVGLTSMHDTGSGSKILDRAWTFSFSGVALDERSRQVWGQLWALGWAPLCWSSPQRTWESAGGRLRGMACPI